MFLCGVGGSKFVLRDLWVGFNNEGSCIHMGTCLFKKALEDIATIAMACN